MYRGDAPRRKRRITIAKRSDKHSIVANQNQWDKLDNATIESILARLPVADFILFQFVCRRWFSVIHSPTFHATSHELLDRRPWFYMLKSKSLANVIYDMEVRGWREAYLLVPKGVKQRSVIPVSAAGGLMCFRSGVNALIVCNPVTGSMRCIQRLATSCNTKAIVMHVTDFSYNIFIILAKSSDLVMHVFSSAENTWTKLPLRTIVMDEEGVMNLGEHGQMQPIPGASIIKWTPMKELAGVTITGDAGEVAVYYLTSRGVLVGIDTSLGLALMHPRLFDEEEVYAIDLVECGGRILVVTLTEEEFEIAKLQVWEFNYWEREWDLVSTMPLEMSEDYYGIDADINCSANGDHLMVCVTSRDDSSLNWVVMYNAFKNTWVELPMCFDARTGRFRKFVSAYSFMPDMTACV